LIFQLFTIFINGGHCNYQPRAPRNLATPLIAFAFLKAKYTETIKLLSYYEPYLCSDRFIKSLPSSKAARNIDLSHFENHLSSLSNETGNEKNAEKQKRIDKWI
jgi:hypothetical protein